MLTNIVDKFAYQGDGSTLTFAIKHDIIVNDQNETLVYVRDETIPTSPVVTLKTYGALQDYTLTGASPPSTPFNNTVTFNAGKAPTSSQKVIIIRAIPLTELLNLATSGNFDYQNINIELMRIVAMLQQLNEITTRSPLLNISTQKSQLNIPEPQANTVIGFDSSGANLQLYPTTLFPYSSETQVTAADNTSSQALTGFSLDHGTYSSAIVRYSVRRSSTAGALCEIGYVVLTWDSLNSVWRISNPTFGPDMAGVTWSVSTASGVASLTFATDSFSLGGSSYVGKLRYKVIDVSLLET